MALILIKEDGTGKADANSYADVAECDAYHDGHLYATAWTGATEENKAAALVMATRLIDVEIQFNGTRSNYIQALQWPRSACPERDNDYSPLNALLMLPSGNVPADQVPRAVIQATCEMARELLLTDRTAAPRGEGLRFENTGGIQTGYDKNDRRPVLSQVTLAMLSKYGAQVSSKSGSVRLVRS